MYYKRLDTCVDTLTFVDALTFADTTDINLTILKGTTTSTVIPIRALTQTPASPYCQDLLEWQLQEHSTPKFKDLDPVVPVTYNDLTIAHKVITFADASTPTSVLIGAIDSTVPIGVYNLKVKIRLDSVHSISSEYQIFITVESACNTATLQPVTG